MVTKEDEKIMESLSDRSRKPGISGVRAGGRLY